jgi:hypothetical protein
MSNFKKVFNYIMLVFQKVSLYKFLGLIVYLVGGTLPRDAVKEPAAAAQGLRRSNTIFSRPKPFAGETRLLDDCQRTSRLVRTNRTRRHFS